MEKITINAEEICEFPSFQSWVNHASSWLGGIRDRSDVLLCLDKEDNCCNNGADFMKARDNDRFPVKAFILTRSKDT